MILSFNNLIRKNDISHAEATSDTVPNICKAILRIGKHRKLILFRVSVTVSGKIGFEFFQCYSQNSSSPSTENKLIFSKSSKFLK